MPVKITENSGESRGKTPSALCNKYLVVFIFVIFYILNECPVYAYSSSSDNGGDNNDDIPPPPNNTCLFDEERCQQAKVCANLLVTFNSVGWLPHTLRDAYCQNSCDFLRISCYKAVPIPRENIFDKMFFARTVESDYMERLFDKFLKIPDIRSANEVMWLVVFRFSPLLLSFIPIAMSMLRIKSTPWGIVLIAASLLTAYLSEVCYMVTAHNVLIIYTLMLTPAGSTIVVDMVLPFVCVMASLTFMFIFPVFWQFTFVFVSIIGFYFYLYEFFFRKRSGNVTGIMIVITEVFILIDEIGYIREIALESSLISACIEATLNTIIPFGRSGYFTQNVIYLTRIILSKIPFHANTREAGVIIFLMQFVFFISFRMAIGGYCIYELRYKMDFDSLTSGFIVYSISAFDSLIYAVRYISGREKFQDRRFFYAVSSGLLTYTEYYYAREFFFYKLVCSLLDKIIFQSAYGRSVHYLGCNMNYQGMAFPQDNSLPWVPVSTLMMIQENVKRIVCLKDNIQHVKGVGFLMKTSCGSSIYTISHVIEKAKTLSFGGTEISAAKGESLNNSHIDSVVRIPTRIKGGAEIDILSKQDVPYIKFIIVSTLGDDADRPYMNVCREFEVKGNDLKVYVDLKKGDSGCPVIAILRSGKARYCGAVSKGSRDTGAGNLVTFVCVNTSGDISDSDGEVDPPVEFNRVRGRPLAYKPRYKHANLFNDFQKKHHPEILRLPEIGDKVDMDDILQYEVEELYEMYFISTERDREKEDDGNPKKTVSFEDEDNETKKQRRKARKKSSAKDKHFRKRQLQFLKDAYTKLLIIHPDENVVISHMTYLMKGHAIPTTDWAVVVGKPELGFVVTADADEDYDDVDYG